MNKNIVIAFLLVISFLEGGALLATELISAKHVAPFFGNTINTWAFMLAITLLGLAFGYLLGSKIVLKPNFKNYFFYILLALILYNLFLAFVVNSLLSVFLALPLYVGLFLSVFLIVFPVMLLYGTVSPIVITFCKNIQPLKTWIGTVFSVSTIGGVVFCFIYGLYIIPFYGIKESWMLNSFFMAINMGLFAFIKKQL
jgi:hypothetical protein